MMRVLISFILTSVLSGSLAGCSAQPIETYDSVQQAEAQQLWAETCKDWDDWTKRVRLTAFTRTHIMSAHAEFPLFSSRV